MRSAVLLAASLAALTTATAAAQVGAPCAGIPDVDDRCETWTAVYDDPSAAIGSNQLEPRVAASTDGRRVFVSAINQHKNLADPSNSPASWTVLGYDGETGAERWQRTFSGPGGYDRPNAITASRDGALVVATGGSYNAPLFTATDRDLMTIAYDGATGQERWRAHSAGAVKDVGTAVLLSRDESQVFVMVNDSVSGGDIDGGIAAYDAADGTLLWRTPYRGLGLGKVDSPKSMALSPVGDLLYLAVESGGQADFDADYATVAFATGGAEPGQVVWESRFDGVGADLSDRASDLAVDLDGRVIVTGDSLRSNEAGNVDMDYATVAYDGRDGRQLWTSRYAGPANDGLHFGRVVATSPTARLAVVAGQSAGAAGDSDWATLAYDTTTGQQQWVARLATPQATTEFATDVVLSADGMSAVLAGVSGGGNPTNYRDLNRSNGITVSYAVTGGGLEWTARLTGDDETDSFSPRAVVLAADGSALTVGQLTNNVQTDESDNVYDVMLVAYREPLSTEPVVPDGRPWLLAALGVLTAAGCAARRRRGLRRLPGG